MQPELLVFSYTVTLSIEWEADAQRPMTAPSDGTKTQDTLSSEDTSTGDEISSSQQAKTTSLHA